MNGISYIDWNSMSNDGLAELLGDFVKKQRLEQNRTQENVSKAAGISRSTLSLLERGERVTLGTFIKVLRTLDLLYTLESFRIQKQVSPIMLAEMDAKYRKRASKSKEKTTTKSNW